jgi:FG-GAP-like repeat
MKVYSCGTDWCALRTRKALPALISCLVVATLAGGQTLVRDIKAPASKPPGVNFTPPQDFVAQTLPFATATGDFNGDHVIDLAVISVGAVPAAGTNGTTVSTGISVLLGNGDGTFRPAVNYPAGNTPISIATKDLNGDHILDLVVADEIGRTVMVFIGNGDGTFKAGVSLPAGQAPRHVAIGDVNLDGKRDLVVANNNGNDVSIFLGNGDSTFKPYVGYPAHTHPKSVAIGDFNNDGKPDLAVANHDTSDVSVLLGNGDGTFQTAVNYPVGLNPRDVKVADFNKDGKMDLVSADGGANTASVLLGNGDGTFKTAVPYVTGGSPRSVDVADLNGDGITDIVAANYSSSSVSVLLGNGDGTFQPAVKFMTEVIPTSVTVNDYNGDGKPDLAVTIGGSNTAPNDVVSILLNIPAVVSPTSLTYGSLTVGTKSLPKIVTLSNTGASSLPILSILTSGANPGDFQQTNNCGSSVGAGASCSITVLFIPTAVGTRTANLVISYSGPGSPQTVVMTGTGK